LDLNQLIYATALILLQEQETDAINVNYSTWEIHANLDPIN
jgi:hypothetical protein